ncbi:TIGR02680 family protein [Tumebacillus permanentifrigoris]|uniref:Uncharacterized protein (TIGR02680 family) n=1 Tax=Tumebacillus permanentifrigoris TaxID=378543 RepID=A0A316D6K8_9BACL|nr:TIGR02680 family protein [Tumebacillus permanentifrigoris]PWK04931.1 uncharacterized protein (TIGR02680 family) [Tumebacillus permanentifrigoris]
MITRWKLHRAGLFNFWYYEDQEFVMEDGRVLFRGSNGAGKSVTMQSFIPVVLDGDTRPHRLDPFGSRDRRMEYYLLGEDQKNSDSTGYLWMEFKDPSTRTYLTIGIGLRARRSHNLDFWGFSITDGRRIGQTFDLYESDYSFDRESKFPLDWKGLERAIGSGGKVVRERKEYKCMVNRLLFKYSQIEQYEDMLNLLIQLRSPKLSKDFKPSTIYEILNNGLPPLQDDELRPLAEVLEAIDQIGERKDELETHVGFVKRVADVYQRYNEYQMYSRSGQVMSAEEQFTKLTKDWEARNLEYDQCEATITKLMAQEREAENAIRQMTAELNVLQKDEAFQTQEQLMEKMKNRDLLQTQLMELEGRVQFWQRKKEQIARDQQECAGKLQLWESQRQNQLQEMEATAADMEFTYHQVAHLRISREAVEDEPLWANWKRELDSHEQALKRGLELAREYEKAKQKLRSAETELHEATLRRDDEERLLHQAEEGLETGKKEQQRSLWKWKSELKVLQVEDREMEEALRSLADFPVVRYEQVRLACTGAYEQQLDAIRHVRLELRNTQEHLKKELAETKAELQGWQEQREPEPPRTEARVQTRLSYAAGDIQGVPLYESCEFRREVPLEVQAQIEALLQETGLLDAWIGDKGLQWSREDQEFWIQPDPVVFGASLADYLRPTPPEDCSVSGEHIDSILRSIEMGDVQIGSARVVLSEEGYFRLGTMLGKVPPKSRVEFIGRESRRQTRLAKIAVLQAELERLQVAVQQYEQVVAEQDDQERRLQAEWSLFPKADLLEELVRSLEIAKGKWQAAREVVETKNEQYKRVLQQEQERRRALSDATGLWNSLKSESQLAWGVEQVQVYRGEFFSLRTLCDRMMQTQAQLRALESSVQDAVEQLEMEQDKWSKQERDWQEADATVEALRKVMEDLHVEEKVEQLRRLTTSISETKEVLHTVVYHEEKGLIQLRSLRLNLVDKVESLKIGREESLAFLDEKVLQFAEEWRLHLTEWRGQELPADRADALKVCRKVHQRYRGVYDARRGDTILKQLYDVFHEVRPHLLSYVLEMEEAGSRQVVHFMMDRTRPISPERQFDLLQRLLEEQNLLMNQKERELMEKILLQDIGVSIRQKIQRAEEWVRQMNELMENRDTSSGLKLKLKWEPRPKNSEQEMDTSDLVRLLRIDYVHLTDEDRERIQEHFRSKIQQAKSEAEHTAALRVIIHEFLDYRKWYRFQLSHKKGEQAGYRELTDSQFNAMSGGEKAMAMYIPLLAAASSRYKGASSDCPKLISLDEAFAGVDEENVRDLFKLLTEMDFDYMMTSQVLWGCFDTVKGLAIYEIVRPKNADHVDVIRYYWNGVIRVVDYALSG